MSEHLIFLQLKFGKNKGRRQLSRKDFALRCVVPEFTEVSKKEKQMSLGCHRCHHSLHGTFVLGCTPPTDSYRIRKFCELWCLPQKTTAPYFSENRQPILNHSFTLLVLIGTTYHTTGYKSKQDAKDYSHVEPPRTKLSLA